MINWHFESLSLEQRAFFGFTDDLAVAYSKDDLEAYADMFFPHADLPQLFEALDVYAASIASGENKGTAIDAAMFFLANYEEPKQIWIFKIPGTAEKLFAHQDDALEEQENHGCGQVFARLVK